MSQPADERKVNALTIAECPLCKYRGATRSLVAMDAVIEDHIAWHESKDAQSDQPAN
jgi:hypothetical protein